MLILLKKLSSVVIANISAKQWIYKHYRAFFKKSKVGELIKCSQTMNIKATHSIFWKNQSGRISKIASNNVYKSICDYFFYKILTWKNTKYL